MFDLRFAPRLEFLAILFTQRSGERLLRGIFEQRFDGPVLDRNERFDFALAVNNHAHGDGLNTAGGEPAVDLLPEEWRKRVADQTIENAARLLGMHEFHVEFPGILDGMLDRRFGDFVERDAVHGFRVLL